MKSQEYIVWSEIDVSNFLLQNGPFWGAFRGACLLNSKKTKIVEVDIF